MSPSPRESKENLESQPWDNNESRSSVTVAGSPNEQQPVVNEKEVPPPPDGGLEAWLVVVGAWCTSFCSFGWVNSECSFIGEISKQDADDHRYWNFPELLRVEFVEDLLVQYHFLDPFATDFLHVCDGKFYFSRNQWLGDGY